MLLMLWLKFSVCIIWNFYCVCHNKTRAHDLHIFARLVNGKIQFKFGDYQRLYFNLKVKLTQSNRLQGPYLPQFSLNY